MAEDRMGRSLAGKVTCYSDDYGYVVSDDGDTYVVDESNVDELLDSQEALRPGDRVAFDAGPDHADGGIAINVVVLTRASSGA